MPTYESTIGESDLELGQEYFGSIVTKVDQKVTTDVNGDNVEMYVVKRAITLKNGVTMTEEYHREKSLGEIKSKKYELPKGHFEDESHDDSDARAKARAIMKKNQDPEKKKKRPKKNKSLPPKSPKKLNSPTKSPKKKKSRSIPKGMEGIEPWFNFNDVQDGRKPRPKRRPEPREEPGYFETDFDPFPATIVPESKASSAQSTPLRGVWKQVDGTNDNGWDPMDVVVSKRLPTDLEPEEPRGILAIAECLNPKAVGKLRPDQLKFLPPGKKPPPFFKAVGHWRPLLKNGDWPPVTAPIEKITKDVGKIKLEEIWAEKIPSMAIIYPRNDAPDCQDKDKEIIIAKGTWKFSEDKPEPEGADTWVPTYVQLDLNGSVHNCEVETSYDDNEQERPHGVWGMNPADDANAATPTDLWFYPPDEEMDEDFRPIGKWKMMKESLWPPKSIGHVVDKRKFKQYKGSLNNVGKLKMPAFFSGK